MEMVMMIRERERERESEREREIFHFPQFESISLHTILYSLLGSHENAFLCKVEAQTQRL